MRDAVVSSPPVRPDLFSADPPGLVGAECGDCGGLSFPRERVCPHCGARDPAAVVLPHTGTLYSYSVVRFAAPGYCGPVPYAVGIVELDGRIRIASTLLADPLESLAVGATVRLTLLEIPTGDGPVLSYAHTLVTG